MQPPPLLADESRRLATLLSLGVLDTEAEDSFDAIAATTAQLTGCPMAAVSLVDAERQWFKATYGEALQHLRECPRAIAFCAHTIARNESFEVPDATQDPRFEHNPLVTGAPHIRLYAAEPLRLNGVNIGTLYVVDTQPRSLTPEQRQALRRMTCVTIALLTGRRRGALIDEERSRLLDFARAAGDWMWETDAQLRYTWVSSGAFEAITGKPPAAMKGQPISDSPLLDRLGQPLESGESFHDLLRQHRPIHRVITDKLTARGTLQISRSAVPVFDAQGEFAGYRGTARDVSDFITSERQTHAQAQLLRKLSSQVPGVIFQFHLQPDHRLSYSYASNPSRHVAGHAPDDEGIAPTRNLLHSVHPDDEPSVMRSLIDAGRSLSAWHREYRVRGDDEQTRWLETRASPELHPDGGTLWHGFTTDVTARKEIELALRSSEERWDMAASAAGIGIAQLNLRTGLVSFDARACVNHGLRFPQTDYTLTDWVESIHIDDRAGAQAALQQAMQSGGRLEARYRLHLPDGREPTLEILARCTFDESGHVDGMVGTCRDVTQQTVHEQLRSDKEAAERTSRAKSEFLSRVSHELRTPMNGILGFAQLMAIDGVNPLAGEQMRRLDSVLRAGRHLLELINDMLNLARIEQEDFSLQQMPVDLVATVESCFALIQPLADSADVHLVPPPSQSLWALADARAVEQVLLNLLSNAIKYNRPGGSVRMALQRSSACVHVAVTDDGEGITEAQQVHLFQPFNRLGAELRRVEGTGLGLVIARELATSMSGELTVHSMPGVGSTFTLSLPTCQPPAAVQGTGAAAAQAWPDATPAHRQVLYIEDEPLNVLLMQEVFKARPQWHLQIAHDGQSGMASVRAQHHDLLLIDMNLPDMTGLELIRALRGDAQTRQVHCIALSADAMQAQIDAALQAGFDGYWTKPINITQMLEGLSQALSGPPP